MTRARAAGVPCPEILATTDGASIVEEGGRFHTLYSWAPGMQLTQADLSPGHARSIGANLAKIQVALRGHRGRPGPSEVPFDLPSAEARLVEVVAAVEARPDADALRWVVDNLEARRRWLGAHPVEPLVPADRLQVFHGDFQLTNLFFDADDVSSVIDWDKARVGWPAWEVVRTLDYGVEVDPVLGQALLEGYRSVLSLPVDELAVAAAVWEHYAAQEVWELEEAYLRGNERVGGLVRPASFVPFLERWSASGLA